MKYKLIDKPHFVSHEIYNEVTDKLISKLASNANVIAIYTIGHVGNPGISDIDMLIIVKDNCKLTHNFRADMSDIEKYLFLHQPYACSESGFKKAETFSFFHNYNLVHGIDVRTSSKLNSTEIEILKKQTALEFLLKMFMQLYIQKKYRILRVRDLLLHGKALIYDLEFLNISSGNLYQLVQKVIEWRKEWFNKTPTDNDIIEWFESLFFELNLQFTQNKLFSEISFPESKTYSIAKNITLKASSNNFSVSHSGFIVPMLNAISSKKGVRILNRFNSFHFDVPSSIKQTPSIITERFETEAMLRSYGKKFLPYFLPMTSSLHLN
ncbi:MAG TPA: hypothetical protein DFH96_09165 [Bacteroidetes bacterium]|nr:hypothetical protein [Bacteroidota bacterium]